MFLTSRTTIFLCSTAFFALTKVYAQKHMLLLHMRTRSPALICFQCSRHIFDNVTLCKHVTAEEEMPLSCSFSSFCYRKKIKANRRVVILVINNAIA